MKLKIKKEFENEVIGFNGSGKPLKGRKDLEVLAVMALKSKNKNLLNLFEEIPTLEELEKEK